MSMVFYGFAIGSTSQKMYAYSGITVHEAPRVTVDTEFTLIFINIYDIFTLIYIYYCGIIDA